MYVSVVENDTVTATAVMPAGTGKDSENGEGRHSNAAAMGITATVMLR